jgi:clan AA aspartic protease (TIGR02281 family)
MVAVMLIAGLAITAITARHLEMQTRSREAPRVPLADPPPGERYTGGYLNGKYNGQGTLVYANGEKYVGEFRDNLRNGRGTYSWPDGRRYVGEFRDGQPNGYGRYTLANGEEYAGDYRNNVREGHGVYTWPDLRRYEGEFHNNLPNGQGVMTLSGGQRQVGLFRDGEYVGEAPITGAAIATPAAAGTVEIKLERSGATFTAPVLLNGTVESQFYIDSGATDVSVPMDTFDALLKAGTVSRSDVSGVRTYRMANGSTMKSLTFIIRSLKIGPIVLENVRGSAVDGSAPPLLGMSFLGRFKSWTLDNQRGTLIVSAYTP